MEKECVDRCIKSMKEHIKYGVQVPSGSSASSLLGNKILLQEMVRTISGFPELDKMKVLFSEHIEEFTLYHPGALECKVS